MLFSIITATKNAATEIKATLLSVADQKNVECEHIIIDSVSTDETIHIVETFVTNHSITILSEPDVGIADAFNKGISSSTGDWLIFMGAGDTFVDNLVLCDYQANLATRQDALVVWGNIILTSADMLTQKHVSGSFKKNALKRYMCMPHQATFHNRELFKRYGLYSLQYKIAMDYDLILRCFSNISTCDYVDRDVSYMLTGGISQKYSSHAVSEYRDIQIDHKINPKYIAYGWYYWAKLKQFIKSF